MAEVVQEKSRGLTFAEKQLKRHGWKEGKGLGREENGISEAIKVKVKCNKGGVGHKEGEQFTFHWWDHVFNKASSSLQVESDQNGIALKKTVTSDDDGSPLSNKKPRKAALAKAKLYGCFVKSATLLSGQERPETKSSKSDDSSSSSSSSSDDEDDQRLDLSSTTKISDAALMKACGGRTAHKGARHGLTMSAKLARLEQQEAEFMAKYGKKTHSASETTTAGSSQSSDQEVEGKMEENSTVKTKKKKKSKKKSPEFTTVADEDVPVESVKTSKKKKKSKSQEVTEETSRLVAVQEEVVQNGEVEHLQVTKNKRKKKGTNAGEELTSPDFTGPETTSDGNMKKKKKKSSKQNHEEEQCDSKTSSRKCVDQESEGGENEPSGMQKRKKCKKDKEGHEEELRPKKKKKKSKDE
ncbi:G patch domain-containing protein 4 [Neosynchiropus ocellatus]